MPPETIYVHKPQSVLFHSHDGATYTASTDACARRIPFPNTAYHLMPSLREIPSSYRVYIWYGKTRMAGLQSREGCMMIDSRCLGTIHQRDRHTYSVTDTHTAMSP